jgi:hypothetical protein
VFLGNIPRFDGAHHEQDGFVRIQVIIRSPLDRVPRVEKAAVAPILEFMDQKDVSLETFADNAIIERLVKEGYIDKLYPKTKATTQIERDLLRPERGYNQLVSSSVSISGDSRLELLRFFAQLVGSNLGRSNLL